MVEAGALSPRSLERENEDKSLTFWWLDADTHITRGGGTLM